MDEIIKHLGNIYAIDRPTLGLIAALSAVSAFVLRDYMANAVFAIFSFPVLFTCSVLVQYIFILGDVYVFGRMDQWAMWTIIASIVGNIAGIALVAWFGRLRDAITMAQGRR
ncbi:MAG: hypothetical protein K2X43_06820 [Hyphomonadaceae bacterium]|nr:hypothetical protein [Hyphomonadaceae bacterium]